MKFKITQKLHNISSSMNKYLKNLYYIYLLKSLIYLSVCSLDLTTHKKKKTYNNIDI